MRSTRTPASAAALAAALAIAVPQATAATVDVRTSTVTIRPQRTETFNAPCPRGSYALAGGVRSVPPGSAGVAGSIPQDAVTWGFSIDARNSTAPLIITAYVTCLTLPPPPRRYAASFNPATPKTSLRIKGGQTGDAKLGCPADYRPTGYGVQASGGTQPIVASVGVVSGVTVVRAKPVGGNVELSLSNAGGVDKDITVAAQCIPRRPAATLKRPRRGKPPALPWRYRAVLQSSPETLAAGDNNDRRRRCARHRRGKRRVRSKAVSTWTELPATGTSSVFTSFPVGRDGLWNIYSSQGGQATLHLLCLSARSRWG